MANKKKFKRGTKANPSGKDFTFDTVLVNNAFDFYYLSGPGRNLEAVAQEFKVTVEVATEWAQLFQWDEKVQQRNKTMNQAFTEEYVTRSMGIRNRIMTLVNRSLENMERSTVGLPFDVTSVDDFGKLARAYETMVRANVMAIKVPGAGGGSGDDPGNDEELTWAEIVRLSQLEEQE